MKIKPVVGMKVQLLRDQTTRGNVKFRAGVVMEVISTDVTLSVVVRAKRKLLRLYKAEFTDKDFKVIYVPEQPGE